MQLGQSMLEPSPSITREASSMSAVEKVEKYMRVESRLSTIDKPEQDDEETKAQYSWRLIRHCVKQAVTAVAKADAKDIAISHGVHHLRKLNHPDTLHQVIFNKNNKEYFSVSGLHLRSFEADGRKKQIFEPEEYINRMLYAPQVNLFVGWKHNHQELFLMSPDCKVISMSEAVGKVLAMVYNENVGEVITIGQGFFTSWVFRYGGRHLLPRKTTMAGMPPDVPFNLLALEETASRNQRAYAAYGTSVAVFNVFEGRMKSYRHELHTRTITALLFFNPLKYLVTGAKDGSIKVWDEKWHLQLVFVGHGNAVSTLAVYPYGPLIMSGSHDCTIRVWSLETCDEVDRVETSAPVTGLSTTLKSDTFASWSPSHADLWKVQHIQTLHSTIGHKVMHMKSTDHPQFPVRSVLLCKDSSVRILSPTTGDILTTLLQESKRWLVDATYAIEEELLFAVFGNGDMVKASTTTNPCRVIAEWKCTDFTKACNYLMVYEYVIGADIANDTWAGMKRAIATKGLAPTPNTPGGKKTSANRTLLLGGRKDGQICVFNMDTGKVDFEIEAHGTKGVLSMIANSKNDQLISAGLDNIIKIWRLYPYAQESLAPLMSFYCAHTPIYMTVMRSKLSVAFQEHSTATYSVVMYNLESRNRHDHGPEDDHMDSICGLTSCTKLRILASASLDGTIRIWNEQNNLIRLVRLNAVPTSLCFCSLKGDILVGVGNNVYRIDYKNYLPKPYRYKMVSMQFPTTVVEKALAFNDDLLEGLPREDIKRLKMARSSFKFSHFMDILTDDETNSLMKEKKRKDKAFSVLEKRENELAKLRDGEIKPNRRKISNQTTKNAAFEKYLKIFYDRPKVKLYEEDPYAFEELLAKKEGDGDDEEEAYKPDPPSVGFFPGPATARPEEETEVPIPIKADGFVPNSVLVRLLWPQKVLEEQARAAEEYIPPSMTAEQMAQITALNKKRKADSFQDTTIFLDYDDEKKSVQESDDDFPVFTFAGEATKKKPEPEPEPQSNFMAKMMQQLEKPITPPESPEPPKPPTPEPPKPQRQPKSPKKPLVKFVSKPPEPPKKAEFPRIPSPVSLKTPSPPPPPPTPLPDFITQFTGEQWFDRYFNDVDKILQKPWTVSGFVSMLLKTLQIAEYKNRVEMLRALKRLFSEESVPNADSIAKSVLSLLSDQKDPPTCLNDHEKQFIIESLQLLQLLGMWNREFYVELLFQFLESDKDVRNICMDLIRACGLKDPQGYLVKELDGWDVWNIDENNRARELRKLCSNWLDKWLTSFRMHVEDTIERLKKGQNIHGRLQPGQARKTKDGKSILKRPNVDSITESDEAHNVGMHLGPSTRASSASSMGSRMLTVTFDKPPDQSMIDNATYVEGMNYFVEMTIEKEMERLRQMSMPKLTEKAKEPLVKNTVLVLPKMPSRPTLVRLGETHTSKCRPNRETSLTADLRLPPMTSRGRQPDPGDLYAFPGCINLPLKTVYMNPFPSPLDQLEMLSQQPLLLTLKTSQKYFVPSRSYLPSELPA